MSISFNLGDQLARPCYQIELTVEAVGHPHEQVELAWGRPGLSVEESIRHSGERLWPLVDVDTQDVSAHWVRRSGQDGEAAAVVGSPYLIASRRIIS